jgi:tetratricopeptide (TPR) repeat protein
VFEQAIAKDPSFAPAYAGLAVAHLSVSGQSRDNSGEVVKMRAAADKAIPLDPVLAEAYDALGAAEAREAQRGQSENSFRRSMEIPPGRPEWHGYFAIFYLLPLGRTEEAIRHLRIAQNSDPLFTFFLADALADTGRNEEASAICNTLQPDSASKEQCLPGALVRLGKASEVIQNYAARPDNPAWVKAALACAYAHAGRRADAKEVAVQSGQYQAPAFACLGDKDRVFESLDRMAVLGPIGSAGSCSVWIVNVPACCGAIRGSKRYARKSACRSSRYNFAICLR